jgi:hypothetical protein
MASAVRRQFKMTKRRIPDKKAVLKRVEVGSRREGETGE